MATTTERDDRRTDHELTCPVPSCSRAFDSAPAVMGHVGSGHDNGWERAVRLPREIHQTATAHDTAASGKVARVQAFLARQAVLKHVTVWFDHGYGTVQIETDGHLDDDDWGDLWRAAAVDGVRYVGDGRFYVTDEFVEDLPDVPADGQCAYPGCDRDGPRTGPIVKDGEAAVLCPEHRKDFLGVSS